MFKFLGYITSLCLAVVVFHAIFFQLAPYIAGMIPAGEWHRLVTLVIYVVIAWCGGIVIPIWIFIIGCTISTVVFE